MLANGRPHNVLYVQPNTEARHPACKAHAPYYIANYDLSRSTTFCHIILPSMTSPALPHFATLSHKRHDFREKVTEHKMCVIFSATSVSEKFSFWEEFRDVLS